MIPQSGVIKKIEVIYNFISIKSIYKTKVYYLKIVQSFLQKDIVISIVFSRHWDTSPWTREIE